MAVALRWQVTLNRTFVSLLRGLVVEESFEVHHLLQLFLGGLLLLICLIERACAAKFGQPTGLMYPWRSTGVHHLPLQLQCLLSFTCCGSSDMVDPHHPLDFGPVLFVWIVRLWLSAARTAVVSWMPTFDFVRVVPILATAVLLELDLEGTRLPMSGLLPVILILYFRHYLRGGVSLDGLARVPQPPIRLENPTRMRNSHVSVLWS
jgi:hypothetical protein